MKRLLLSLLLAICSAFLAAETIDLGALELGKEYALQDFKGYRAHYTATATGTLVFASTTTDDLMPYADQACKTALKYTPNTYYGPHTYDLSVTEGTTYYFYTNCIWNSGTTISITLQTQQELLLESASPALGSDYQVANGGQISLNFNKAVVCTGATIAVGSTSKRLPSQTNSNSIFFNDVKDIVWQWLNDGTAKPGDDLVITITGVAMASNRDIKYNGDGTLVATFKVGAMPTVLVSSTHTSGTFFSYYTTTDADRLVTLTFSEPLDLSKASAQLKYGEVDKDLDGDYYVEHLKPTLAEDGKTLIIDLSGRRRKATDMVTSGTQYEQITLGITGVRDLNGNYTYATGSGSLGSYWFAYSYQEVTSNVVAEFTPSHGSDLGKTKSFEIWITDAEKLSYEGIRFDYEKEGQTATLLIPCDKIQREADAEEAGAMILTLPVPAELQGAENILLTFEGLQCADGSDYSNLLRAKYNAFIVSRSTPLNGATVEWLIEEQKLSLSTNRNASTDHLLLSLIDCANDSVMMTAIATKQGTAFINTIERKQRLERNHDYRLDVVAYDAAEQKIGNDYLIWHGAAEPFRFSDMQLTAVSPDTASTLLSVDEPLVLSLQYDGLVLLDSLQCYALLSDGTPVTLATPVATDPDFDGYATAWTLTLPADVIAQSAPRLVLHLVALDLDGRRVEGNADARDYNYLRLEYAVQSGSAIRQIRAEQQSQCRYNLLGQPVRSESMPFVVKNGISIGLK